MKHLLLLILLLPAAAMAQGWTPLTGVQIRDRIIDRELDYDGSVFLLRSDGTADYRSGTDATGRWEIRDDLLCTAWEPEPDWDCVTVSVSGANVRMEWEKGYVVELEVVE